MTTALMVLTTLVLGPVDGPSAPRTKEVAAKDGSFRATWPGEPTEDSRTERVGTTSVAVSFVHLERGDEHFSVQSRDLSANEMKAIDAEKTLDSSLEAFASGNGYKILERRKIQVDQSPAREFLFEIPEGKGRGRARMVLSGKKFFQVVALGGKAEEAGRARAFLDSFALGAIPEASTAWREFASVPGRFHVLLPGTPTQVEKTIETDDGPTPVRIVQAADGPMTYVVTATDAAEVAVKRPKVLIDGTRDVILQRSRAKMVREKSVPLGRVAGREVRAEFPVEDDPKGGILTCRIYLSGRRVYQVMAIGPKDKQDAATLDKFFTSFRPR